MASVLFTPEQKEIILGNPITKIIDAHRDSLPKDFNNFDQDIDKDTTYSLTAFLCGLACAEPANLIKLTDSRDSLADKLFRFATTQIRKRKFSMTLRSQFSSLLDKVASGASDLEVWTAVAQLLNAFDLDTYPNIKNLPSHSHIRSHTSDILRNLQRDWNNDYFPHSLEALQLLVRQYQQLAVKQYYARTLVFVQSSGTGKSRLVDSFGQECPMINFILREEETTGFPPADREILSFLREEPPPNKMNIIYAISLSKIPEFRMQMAAVVWNHTLAAALLQASFEKFNVWVENQPCAAMSLEDLARSRHTEMAPLDLGPNAHDEDSQRPENRIKFCQSVAERARIIADKLISNEVWVKKFKNDAESKVHSELESKEDSNPLNDLRAVVEKLINNLQRTKFKSEYDPSLVIVFDEASSLMRKTTFGEPHPGFYTALNRIISCLKRYPLWSFFLSTESPIGQFAPPDNVKRTGDYLMDSSARRVPDETEPPLKRFPPFVALQLGVEDRRRMQDQDRRVEELRKPLSDFAEPGHMAIFGRPLWYAYKTPEDMNRLARLKLLGGKQYSKFNPHNKDHVFAALSFRLSLDVCLNPTSVSLTRTAVNSFMRVVIATDLDTGTIDTLTPSEPVLAKAAMEHLCCELNWTLSIRTFTHELLEAGLIDKGHKGELYARLVLILAHDLVRWAGQSDPKFQPTFTVFDFLTALYGEGRRDQIQTIPKQIRDATMNFTHFVPAYGRLTSKIIPALCHDLLRRSAAMQLGWQEEAADLLLPIYYGKEDEEFNPSKCGVILVQVKNQQEATTPEKIFDETFAKVSPNTRKSRILDPGLSIRNKDEFAFKQVTNPILLLLFDLGVVRSDKVTSPLVQVSVSDSKISPELWVIHSRGHDKAVFDCLQRMDTTGASQLFFISMPEGESQVDQLARRNRTFLNMQRSHRYLGFDSEADAAGAQEDDVKAQKGKMKAGDATAQEDDVKAQKGKMKADDAIAQEEDATAQEDNIKAQKGKMKADDPTTQEEDATTQEDDPTAQEDDARAQEGDVKAQKGRFKKAVKKLTFRGRGSVQGSSKSKSS